MTRSISRVALITLALVTLFAGSFKANRSSANQAAPNKCMEIAGCPGGPCMCAQIVYPDGTTITCFTTC